MLQLLKNKLKEQKGLTLIELLAVIVILGIIAAIAVPSVLGLIDNTKKDAHIANAQQMISAAKMAVASEASLQTGDKYLNLAQLEDKQYLDPVDSPDKLEYDKGDKAAVYNGATPAVPADTISYVKIVNGKVVKVNLQTTGTTADQRGILKEKAAAATVLSPKDIVRADVQ